MNRKRKIIVVLLAIAALLSTVVMLFDWNLLKPYVERRVTAATGREFLIHGNLDVHLSLHPLIEADGLTLANIAWSKQQSMLDVKRVAFRVDLWQLLQGRVEIPEVTAQEPHVVLERNDAGERNWILGDDTSSSARPPHIGRLQLDHGTLLFDDAQAHTRIVLDVTTRNDAGAPLDRATSFAAHGQFKGLAFAARGEGGDVISLADASTPFPIDARADVGTTHGTLRGT
ncbi:MAG: AsmA family protein, partial [Casimicrobiaceae bacterium]